MIIYHVSSLQRQLCIVLKNYVEYASEESQEYLSQHKLLDILLKKVCKILKSHLVPKLCICVLSVYFVYNNN